MALISQLNTLESSGLIRLAQAQPDLEYLFRHALVQDAAYGSLVKRDRERLHRAVGETLERLYPDRFEELAPLLGQHFAEAGDDERALKYFTLAGDAAARVYANAEAAGHYAQAVAIAVRATQYNSRSEAERDASSQQLRTLYLRRGRALQSSMQYPEAWQNYADMERVARARGDRSLELASLMEQAQLRAIFSPIFDPALARTLLDQALGLAGELHDREAEARILWTLMRITVNAGDDPGLAIIYGERSLALARELNLPEQVAYTLNDLQYAYANAGQVDRALAVLEEARGLWRAQGNLHMLADNLTQTAAHHLYSGRFDLALALADEALAISVPSRNDTQEILSRLILSQVCWERGRSDTAIENLELARHMYNPLSSAAPESVLARVSGSPILARVYGSLGAIDRALALAQSAYELIRSTPLAAVLGGFVGGGLVRLLVRKGELAVAESLIGEAYATQAAWSRVALLMSGGQVQIAEAEVALAGQDHARAAALMDRLVAALRSVGGRAHIPEAMVLQSKALVELGRLAEACDVLRGARAEAEAIGTRRMLWPILAALSQIEAQRGNPVEAQALRQQAREIVEFIADHAGSPELRASFLNLPDVQDVMRPTR